jgi:hypothetical protein
MATVSTRLLTAEEFSRLPQPVARILGENDTVSGEEVIPGFSCRVADLLP